MLFSISRRARFLVTAVLAAPLMVLAESPAGVEKLEYVRPDSVPNVVTRLDARPTRGGGILIPEGLALQVLSPEHTGLTVQEHPSIFWYMSVPVKGVQCKLTVLKDDDIEPLIEKMLDPEKAFGIQRLDLSQIAKGLEDGADYKVHVTLIIDPNDRSKDVDATAHIKRIPASEKLLSRLLARPTPGERAIVYARQGIWYDALSAISDQIAADPANKQLHLARAQLLRKGELKDAADYDEKLGA